MNFGKLLAAGKCMAPGYESGRYQMRERFHLPQFISPKNPFAVEATGAASEVPPTTTETTPVVSAVTPARKWLVWVKRLGVAAKWSGSVTKQGVLWFVDHNPFSSIGRPHLPAIPRFGRPPVQEELSLDKVAVMRGDLEHADLEVRPGGRSNEESSAAWRGLTARVFGGGAR